MIERHHKVARCKCSEEILKNRTRYLPLFSRCLLWRVLKGLKISMDKRKEKYLYLAFIEHYLNTCYVEHRFRGPRIHG